MFDEFLKIGYINSHLYGTYEKYDNSDFYFHDSKFINLHGDKTHYIELLNPNSKKSIILLHGIMVNLNTWRDHLDIFSSDYNIYALDFLGHGLSDKRDITLKDIVDQVHYFIEAKKIKRPIIIGHSLGGLVASIYASVYRCELDKLVIVSSVDYDYFNRDIINKIGGSILGFIDPFINSYTMPFIIHTVSKKVYNEPDRFLNKIEEYLCHVKIKGFKRSILSLMKNHDYPGFSSSNYSDIKCKTLIVHGDNDKLIFPDNARRLGKNIPNSEVIMIKNGSHMIVDELPFEFIQVVSQFLDS
ncbi:MAG TPA: alpha/beta hydrolase [Spirochaetota bacterium]|nr:alpha/beta hydrolase [Spirochaetota bacterium]HOM38409.1 alpha/beta hydrolase [Spirochaetota bacterium]HPQ48948.1 alpha/beta hydrolase [Spirochaetota bacterium]